MPCNAVELDPPLTGKLTGRNGSIVGISLTELLARYRSFAKGCNLSETARRSS